MAKIEEVIKMIYRLYRKKHIQADLPCPDEETLACFSEGKLSKAQAKRLQAHLISCEHCAEVVSLFCQKFKHEREVPQSLINKAKGLIEQDLSWNILEVSLALKEKALEILKTTSDVILNNEIVPLPVLRSRKISDFPDEIKLIKEFKDIKITLHIQKKNKDKTRVTLNLVDKIRLLPLSDLRLTLLGGTKELESYEAPSGNAVFDNIGFGCYSIHISRKGDKLGVIKVEIK